MSAGCDFCGGGSMSGELRLNGGETSFGACRPCLTWAERRNSEAPQGWCVLCHTSLMTPSRADYLADLGVPDGPKSRVCDDCRSALQFSTNNLRELVSEDE